MALLHDPSGRIQLFRFRLLVACSDRIRRSDNFGDTYIRWDIYSRLNSHSCYPEHLSMYFLYFFFLFSSLFQVYVIWLVSFLWSCRIQPSEAKFICAHTIRFFRIRQIGSCERALNMNRITTITWLFQRRSNRIFFVSKELRREISKGEQSYLNTLELNERLIAEAMLNDQQVNEYQGEMISIAKSRNKLQRRLQEKNSRLVKRCLYTLHCNNN